MGRLMMWKSFILQELQHSTKSFFRFTVTFLPIQVDEVFVSHDGMCDSTVWPNLASKSGAPPGTVLRFWYWGFANEGLILSI